MITPLIDTMKAWIPCVTNENYHKPISVVTAVACAALAVFVAEVEFVSFTCAAITVCTLAITYKISMIALSYFAADGEESKLSSTEKLNGPDTQSPPRSPSPGVGFEKVSGELFKPLKPEPR